VKETKNLGENTLYNSALFRFATIANYSGQNVDR